MEVINERLQARYREIERNETRWEEIGVEGADYLMVAFGSVARICDKARELAAEKRYQSRHRASYHTMAFPQRLSPKPHKARKASSA